jgi:hypothetical protein
VYLAGKFLFPDILRLSWSEKWPCAQPTKSAVLFLRKCFLRDKLPTWRIALNSGKPIVKTYSGSTAQYWILKGFKDVQYRKAILYAAVTIETEGNKAAERQPIDDAI